MEDNKNNNENAFKKIFMAIIGAIIIQLGASVYWAGAINERVSSVEQRQNIIEERSISQRHDSRIAVLETQWQNVSSRLDRIDNILLDIAEILREQTAHDTRSSGP